MPSSKIFHVGVLAPMLICLFGSDVEAQGCVVTRGSGLPTALLALANPSEQQQASRLSMSAAYRSLQSDRHFVGSEEQKERRHEGSEVINNSNFFDLTLTYSIDERRSIGVVLPFVSHDRSQVVRANDSARTILQRFHTQSSGLGDVRLMGYSWIARPTAAASHNLLLGVGVDIPTGKSDVEDTFAVFEPATRTIAKTRRTVDQSIQPGDGGWGAVVDVYAFQNLSKQIQLFVNGSYTVTPEEINGVRTYRSNPYEAEMSITDSYLVRTGVEMSLAALPLRLTLAGRVEGVPVHDLIGGSDGFRRPGYSAAIEPGVSARIGKDWFIEAYAPLAVYRNRERSVADRRLSADTGTYRHGDAAFADYSLSVSVRRKF